MKKFNSKILGGFLLAGLMVSGSAHANVYLQLTGFPQYSSDTATNTYPLGGDTNGNTLPAESGFSYELRSTLGFRFNSGLYLGGTYDYAYEPTTRSAGSAASGIDAIDRYFKTQEWGISVGYVGSHLKLIGTYVLSGTKKYKDLETAADGTKDVDVQMENKGASGFTVSASYTFQLNHIFSLGPALVYRNVSYSKQDYVNGNAPATSYRDKAFTTKAKESSFSPMITLGISI